MKQINLPKFNWAKLLSTLFFILLLGAYANIFAIGSPYNPGQTLDPSCPPGEVNCTVDISSSQWTTTGSNIYYNGGNVGIGTTNPVYKFDVNGSTKLSSLLVDDGSNNGIISTAGGYLARYDSTGNFFGYGDDAVVVNNDNVGIGTITPTAKLDIRVGNTTTYINQGFIENDGNGDSLNDATFSGTYNQSYDDVIYIQIDSNDETNTFDYSNDYGDCSGASVPITGSAQYICDGISITFASTTGHTLYDQWYYGVSHSSSITATNPVINISDGTYNYFTVNAVANNSNFIGKLAGIDAIAASNSNFFGSRTGYQATSASNSNFFGSYAGYQANNASGSIFIGQQSGYGDTVNNTSNGLSSILVGSFTNTGGFSNSILLGSGINGFPISNTKANQFMLAPTVTEMRLRGIDYSLPSVQGGGNTFLLNNGAGVLSWGTSIGSVTATSINNLPLSQDNTDFNIKIGQNAGLNIVAGARDNTFIGYEAGKSAAAGGTDDASENTGIGTKSLFSNTIGGYNTANGAQSLYSNTTGSSNTANGNVSLYFNTTGFSNTAIGDQSLYSNTTGYSNTASGYKSLYSNKANSRSTAIGYQSMYYADDRTTGQNTYNTALGYEALKGSTTAANNTGTYNTAIGDSALLSNTSGASNTANGAQSLYSNTTGYNNTANGVASLLSNTTGYNNTALGYSSLLSNTDGNNNTASGYSSLSSNTTGSYNTANGYTSLFTNTTGSNNTASGFQSLSSNDTGSYNTASGNYSLYSNTTGSNNTAQGVSSLRLNKANNRSTSIGYNSMYYADNRTTGRDTYNTAIGYESLKGSTTAANNTGTYNTAIGDSALLSNTTGSRNAASGYSSLYLNTTGSFNIANGVQSLYSNTTGIANIAVGFDAGHYIADGTTSNTTSDYSVYLGSETKAFADDDQNEIVIGASAIGNGSNTATIGNTSLLRTYLTGVNLKAGSATAGTAPLKFTSGTVLGTTEAGAVEYDGTHLYFTATNAGTRYQLDQQGGSTNWDTIGDPSGNGAIAMGSTVQSMDWATATTTNPLSLTAASLTTGNLLSLNSNTLTSGTLLDITSNSTGASTNQKGLNISISGSSGATNGPSYGAYISNTHAGPDALNVGIYAKATGGSAGNYAAQFNGDVQFTNDANRIISVADIAVTPGKNLSILAGYSGSGGSSGGDLKLSGGGSLGGIGGKIYIYPGTGGDTNGNTFIGYNGSTRIGNVSVGSGTVTSLFNVGTSGQFQINDTGAVKLAAGTATAGTAPLKFTSGTVLGTTEAGAVEYDGTHLYFTATNAGTRYQLDQQGGSTNWDTIGDPSGNGAIAMGSTVQSMDWATATTTNPLSLTAASLTTGNLLSLTSNTLTSGALLNLSSNGTSALTNQKGLNIALSGTNGTGAQATYGAYISNTHAGTTSTNVGLYASATGGTTANYAAQLNGDLNFIAGGTGRIISVGYGTATTGSLSIKSGDNPGPQNGAPLYLQAGSSLGGGAGGSIYINGGADGGAGVGNVFLANIQGKVSVGSSTATSLFNVGTSGQFQITSTGAVKLATGTATAGTAPLKFTSGTLLTTTEAGTVEFLTDAYYGTITTGAGTAGARKTFAFLESPAFTTPSLGVATATSINNLPLSQDNTDFNIKIGQNAGLNIVAGAQYNTFLGYEAGKSGSGTSTNVADYNTASGYQSLFSNTSGNSNTATGYKSLSSNTTGYNNTANGTSSLGSNTTGSFNIANGTNSLFLNTTGIGNIAIGMSSLYSNRGSSRSTAIGYQSMYYANDTTTGINTYNTALGYEALKGSTTAANNTGQYNTAVGDSTLYSNTSGYNNSAVGVNSLYSNTTGYYNSAFGYNAGLYFANGSTFLTDAKNSIYIGANTKGKDNGDSNSIVVGYNAIGKGANTAVWGNTDITNHYLNGSVQFSTYGAGTLVTDATGNITASSDEKLKNIQGDFNNNNEALNIISSIKPILYKWNSVSGYDQNTTYAGFSAQNIKELIPEAVGVDPRGYLTLSDRPILATTVNAIKELDLKVKEFSLLDTSSTTSLGSMIKSFLENAGNSIEIVFFGEVHTKKLCLDDLCIDKAQLEKLLKNSESTNGVINTTVNTENQTTTQDQTPKDETKPMIESPVIDVPVETPTVVTPEIPSPDINTDPSSN